MKYWFKNIFFKIIYYFGILELFRFINRHRAVILVYHGVSEKPIRGPIKNSAYLHIDLDNFKQHMQYLRKKYNIVALNQLCDIIAFRKTIPDYSVAITFDDGYRNVFENAFPVLRQYNIPCTIFLISKAVRDDDWQWADKLEYMIDISSTESINIFGRTYKLKNVKLKSRFLVFIMRELKKIDDDKRKKIMEDLISKLDVCIPKYPPAEYKLISYGQARQMSSGNISFGSHTPEHTILPLERQQRTRTLIMESRNQIAKELGRDVDLFSYPNGSFNHWVKRIIKESGFRCGLTTDYGMNGAKSDLFELKRISISSDDSLISFIAQLSGIKKYIS